MAPCTPRVDESASAPRTVPSRARSIQRFGPTRTAPKPILEAGSALVGAPPGRNPSSETLRAAHVLRPGSLARTQSPVHLATLFRVGRTAAVHEGRHRGRAGARILGPIRPGEGVRPSRYARGRATPLHRGM